MKLIKKLTILTLLGIAGVFISAYVLGSSYLSPKSVIVGNPPKYLGAENVTIKTDSNQIIRGWWIKQGQNSPSVVLLHGIGGNRISLIERAKLYKDNGYSVLLIDLPSHGESYQNKVSFGYYESKGVDAAYSWIKNKNPNTAIGAVAISLGGAALVYSKHINDFQAIILESVYSSIDSAIYNRLDAKIGFCAAAVYPLLIIQIKYRLKVEPDSLSPIKRMNKIKIPTYIISGSIDRNTHSNEAKSMYSKLPSSKQLWIVENAAHQDIYRFDSLNYSNNTIQFMDKYLKQ